MALSSSDVQRLSTDEPCLQKILMHNIGQMICEGLLINIHSDTPGLVILHSYP